MEEDIENTPSVEADNGQSFLEMELEALLAIYVNEVEVIHNDKSTSVSIDLHPATADKLDEQYVMMTLKFTLDAEYPHNIPEILIRNPRGLSDEKLNSIIQDLKSIAESKIGNSMLFEVIEAAKEHLTEDNRPCGECAICLCSFSDDDVFTKTHCYHYFHSHCLARYSKTAAAKEVDDNDLAPCGDEVPDKELLCPVCRLPIHFEGSEESFPPPSHRDEDFVIGEDVLEIQKRMADLYQKQVDKGGIIDIEAEKNKYLLEISNVPTRSTEEATSDNLSKEEENASVSTQSLQNEGSKDSNLDSNSPSKNTVSAEEKTKNDKKYNKQPRNKFPNRTNKRYDNSKPKHRSDRERTQKDFSSPRKTVRDDEENSEDNCDDEDSVSKSRGARYEANSYKRNERRSNYDPSRRYEGEYGRGNYYRYPDSRGGNRGRRFPQNGYDRRNFRDHGYRGRGGRSYPEREQNYQNDSKSGDSTQDLAACKETVDQNLPDSSKEDSKFDRDNNYSRNRQYPYKKHSDGAYNKRESYSKNKPDTRDGCPDRDSRKLKGDEEDEHEVTERDGNERSYSGKYQASSYRDRRNYSDIRLDRDSRKLKADEEDEHEVTERDGNERSYSDKHRAGSYQDRRNYSDIRLDRDSRKLKADEEDEHEVTERDGNERSYSDKHRAGSYQDRRNYSDIRLDRDSRKLKADEEEEHEVTERDGNERSYSDKHRAGSYQDRRNYSDIRYSYGEKDAQSQRRGGYSNRDNSGRGSYGRSRNRGSYRNHIRREQSEDDAQIEDGKTKEVEDTKNAIEDEGNKGSDNQNHQFSNQRSSHRGSRGNPRRNGNFYRQNSQPFYERRGGYSNGVDDSRDNRDSYPEGGSDVQIPSSYDKNDGGREDELVEESGSRRYPQRNSQEDYPRRYEDRRSYNPQRGGFRDTDRNRPNTDFRNKSPNYRRNQRYSNERPYRNKSDSYQFKNNSSRKFNSDQYPDASNSTVERENSELHSGENSSEKTVAEVPKSTKVPSSSSKKELLLQESSQNLAHSSENPCKDVPSSPPIQLPAAKSHATFASNSPKMSHPPPGFSNPLKKVVYGLPAANPPPGFPRS